jgi:electron transport complex protein RnfD
MNPNTQVGPFIAPRTTVPAVMLKVLIALLPAIAVQVWWFGWGLAVQLVLACTTALAIETLMMWARGRPAVPAISDHSAVVTAVLLVLCIPPLTPWWVTTLGVSFALIFGKHLYGGLGQNPFNPAMVGYVFLLISFPAELTSWIAPMSESNAAPDLMHSLRTIFGMAPAVTDTVTWDAISQATPLDRARDGLARAMTLTELRADPRFAAQAAWQWLAAAYLLGGLFMLQQKIIRWQAPVAMLGALVLLAAISNYSDPDRFHAPLQHLVLGASMIAAFFIVTDPVTGPASPRGRLIFGAGVGMLIWVIRSWGGYPDAVAFAILLMNMVVPIIDRYVVPRAYGHER